MAPRNGWSDGSLADVRPYTITGGRTHSPHPLHLTTCLITRSAVYRGAHLSPESEALLLHCSGVPLSVAEIAARLHQPAQVVKVLVGDLLDCDALALANPYSAARDDVDVALLEALIHGLHTRL